jgi:hypothetical protein
MIDRLGLVPVPSGAAIRIPPAFADTPLTYGFALLGDLLATFLCLMLFLRIATEKRLNREAEKRATANIPRAGELGWTVVTAHRSIVLGFLCTILLRAAPDAIWMLALGEVSDHTLSILFKIDYSGDFAALIALIWTVTIWAWTRQSIPQQLYKAAMIPLPKLGWQAIRDAAKISGIVTIAAILITIGKANA